MKIRKNRLTRYLVFFVIVSMLLGGTNIYAADKQDPRSVPSDTVSSDIIAEKVPADESGSETVHSDSTESKDVPGDSGKDEKYSPSDRTADEPADSNADFTNIPDSSAEAVDVSETEQSEESSPADNPEFPEDESVNAFADISLPDDLSVDEPFPEEELIGAAVEMPTGLYAFQVKPNGMTQRTLAIKGNSLEEHADMISGAVAQSNVRLFYVEKVTGTYYRIRSLHTGKYLQVTCNRTADGTSVKQKSKGTTTAQQWQFVRSGSGYGIIGRTSGKALTVTGGSAAAGTPLEIRTFSGQASQVWYPVRSSIYISGTGSSVDWPYPQRYTGSAVTPDVTVYVYGKKLAAGKDYDLSFADNVKAGTASVTVTGKGNYGGTRTGTFLIRSYKTVIESGSTYFLVPKSDEWLSVTVAGSVIKNNETFSLAEIANTKSMKFTFLKTSNGNYKILPTNSLYTWTCNTDGTLKLYKQMNNGTQRWTAVRDSQGAFSFVNQTTKQAVTVRGSVRSGSSLVTEEYTKADSQKFYLLKSTYVFPQDPVYIGQYNNTYIGQFDLEVTVTPASTDSRISILKQCSTDTADACSGGYIDFRRKKIGMYRGFAINAGRRALTEQDIPFALAANHAYTVHLIRTNDGLQYLSMEDPATGHSVTVRDYFMNTGRAWGKFEYTVDSGSVKVNSYKMRNLTETMPTLAIIGDSFVSGMSLNSDLTKRYASLISEHLNQDVFICSRGGAGSAMGLNWFNQYIFETVRPKYMLIAFGMNDKNYVNWVSNMQKMIDLAEANGVTPILATIPPNGNEEYSAYNSLHATMSAWVRRSGYRYVDIARALSKNGDGVTWDSSLTSADKIHPNVAGHQKIYEEFLKGFGDL